MNSERSTDEAAVRALYQQLMDGWNQGSGDALAAPFTEDADFIAFDGTHYKGRREIAPPHQRLFDTYMRGTRPVGQVTSVRFLSPTVALMIARGSTIMRGKSRPAPERDSIQTLVATRSEETWRLTAFQNTRIRPIGRNVGGTVVWLLTDRLWRIFRPKQ